MTFSNEIDVTGTKKQKNRLRRAENTKKLGYFLVGTFKTLKNTALDLIIKGDAYFKDFDLIITLPL